MDKEKAGFLFGIVFLGVAILVVVLVQGGFVDTSSSASSEELDAYRKGKRSVQNGTTNPLKPTDSVLETGENLYEQNCLVCHGKEGKGKGPSARALDPPPKNFRRDGFLSSHSDRYLFDQISEGKSGTAMPSFSTSLFPEERWAIVHYLRTFERSRSNRSDTSAR